MGPPGRRAVSVRVWDNSQSGHYGLPPGREEGEGAGAGIGGSDSGGGARGESTPAC